MAKFQRISIIGLGLIGSSIARAAHEHKLASHIVGCDTNADSLAFAKKEGFINGSSTNPAEAVKDCDLVILACPPATLEEVAAAIAPSLKPGAIVMDTVSVKSPAIAAINTYLPGGIDFIPAHPIAGSEKSGVAAGSATLFSGKRVILTPPEMRDDANIRSVMTFWEAMGARVEAMPPDVHDLIYAYVSHLPQLLAFAVAPMLTGYTQKGYEGLQKFTRLCASEPRMWSEIYTLNKYNILKALDRYLDVIHHIKSELQNAPEDSPEQRDEALAKTALLPRIIASCLITTVMEAEKQAGAPFARYAGPGFADFTYPATSAPEDDIERISNQYRLVAELLGDFAQRLEVLRAAIDVGNATALQQALTQP